MSCNSPIPARRLPSGDLKIEPFLTVDRDFLASPGALLLPCRKCLGCKLSRAKQWRDRLLLELESTPGRKGLFLTLTYDNDHLPIVVDDAMNPIGATLNHADVQLFMKRLRDRFKERIRVFGCGEYGSLRGRPHYHLCIFGVGFSDFPNSREAHTNELGQPVFEHSIFSQIWPCGFHSFAALSVESMGYVARYTMKKLGAGQQWYKAAGIKPEYIFMSRNPGIGMLYLEQHPECLDSPGIPISTENGGLTIHVPSAFYRKLELTDPARAAILKEERRQRASDALALELSTTNASVVEELSSKESVLKSKAIALARKI